MSLPAGVKPISTREQMIEVARTLGVRSDWHEPDNVEVNARVVGNGHQLDNCFGYDYEGKSEPNVIITKDGSDAYVVNLANLLAWASSPIGAPAHVERSAGRAPEAEDEWVPFDRSKDDRIRHQRGLCSNKDGQEAAVIRIRSGRKWVLCDEHARAAGWDGNFTSSQPQGMRHYG